MTEYELKFRVPPGRRDAVAAEMADGGAPPMRLRARYFDTLDGRLAAHRMALRLRQEGDARWVQTLKAAGDGAFDRFEHEVEVDGPPPGSRARVPVVPALHAGTDGGDRLLALLRGDDAHGADARPEAAHKLAERYATDVQRTVRTVTLDGATVEIAFDEGRITAGRRRRSICEVEFELKDGPAAPLFALAREGVQRHGLWLDTVSKAERGHRLAEGGAAPPATHGDDADLPARPTGGQALRAVVRACLAQVLPNAGAVAEGSTDAETIHQVRVGLRRLRTALRGLAPLAPGVDATWEAALADTFRRLGRHRDLDHLRSTVQPELAAVGAPPVDGLQDAAGPPPDPGEAVRDAAFQQALLGLVAWSERRPDAAEDGADPAALRKAMRERLDRLHRGLVKDGKRFEALPTDARHRARKRLKRLRYLAEFVAPLFDAKDARRYLKRLRPAQDALGAWHDDVLALAAYEAAAVRDPRAWYAVGWLTAQQPAHAAACHAALRRLGGATPFWG